MLNFLKRLGEFFQDDSGRFSAYRLVFLLGVHTVLALWAFNCIHAKALVPIDSTINTFVTILVGGKVAQSISENFSPK